MIIMYDKTSSQVDVNKLRKHLFTKSTTSMDRLPPTRDALTLHIKRAYLQIQIWASSLLKKTDFKKPDDFGWRKNKEELWFPHWCDLPEAAVSCRELVNCGCKKGCAGKVHFVVLNFATVKVLVIKIN